MNENDPANDARLHELLRLGKVSPGLPPRFQEQVWRRVEAAEIPLRTGSWLEALAAFILQPRFALTAAVILLVAGVLAGTMEGRQAARQVAQMHYLAAVAPQADR